MDRRLFLTALGASTLIPLGFAHAQKKPVPASVEALQTNWRDFAPAGRELPTPNSMLRRTNEEWRKVLTAQQYNILREEGTEFPGTSELNNEKRAGLYVCAGCELPLFTSAMKFDSGTGWPSFFTTIPGVFQQKTDHKLGLPRDEYHCIRCGGHHGHVFDDGPKPTGLRYCNNGIALKFVPKNA
jgi:peptide-methionine (R)-S-oxide reductase